MNDKSNKQKDFWGKEHANPHVLLPMDSRDPSSGITLFYDWLQKNSASGDLRGLEMGSGKGRNSIWLAKKGIKMTAFDFSEVAIKESQKRAEEEKLGNISLFVHDATQSWPLESDNFDIAVDCFASTDIDSLNGRSFARDEFKRVLKSGGYLFLYALSTEDEFHREMLQKYPTEEKNSFLLPVGQFMKIYDEDEIKEFYKDFKLVEQRRIDKVANFFGKNYKCRHFWLVLQKI